MARSALGNLPPWPSHSGRRSSSRAGAPARRPCSKAGIRRIRLHDTRHTCESLLAALDVHPRIAMQILRHSKIAVTMEIYTHVPSEATRKALRRLGKHLGKQDRK
ncbi:tyrosine-type recombinase/integrase [Streptomyces asiaticus]